MREETDRRTAILDAAFEEFAAKGFKGATIKSIARAARLQSPALIYWYFKDKGALFQAVLGAQAPILQAVVDPAPLMGRPPEEVLPALARAYLATADSPLAQRALRLLAPEALRHPEIADMFVKSGPARVLGFLQDYLARQVETGRFRPHDTRAGARAFIGMLIPQLAGNLLFPALRADGLTDEEHLRETVEIFLRGLQPDPDVGREGVGRGA